MRKLIMLASVAALTATLPSLASAKKPGHANARSAHAERSAEGPRARNQNRARQRVRTQEVDRNRNGIADRLERRLVDRNRDGIDDRTQNLRTGSRYGGANCPPGLANRTPACVPPGQARRMFNEGQRVPNSYDAFTSYNDIPLQYRQQVPTGYNYIYRDNSVYVVDPRTRLVRDIINLIRP
jgi:hypothetical protein